MTTLILNIIVFVRRTRLISKIDRRTVSVLRENHWIEIPWTAVAVGDIIKLSNGDVAPADVVLLATMNGASCAIDTHIIDGSKQLKARMPLRDLQELSNPDVISDCEFVINSTKEVLEPGLSSKVVFSGTIISGDRTATFGNSQFIERYSAIYQNSGAICGVLYTGSDCRTVNNNSHAPVKFSKLENMLNIQNSVQIVLVILGAAFMGAMSIVFRDISQRWPFYDTSSITDFFIANFRNYLILLFPLVPLELYWIIDIILYIHSLFLESDNEGTVASISTINDLAEIDTIMISKSIMISKNTNIMRVFVNGVVYGQNITSCYLAANIESDILTMRSEATRFQDGRLVASDDTRLFFLHLALCHSAVPIVVNEYIGYVSNFAEDEPLLKLAGEYGFVLMRRIPNELVVNIKNKLCSFRILNLFPPSPQHPRISILFRDVDGSVKMFIRGDVDSMRDFVEIPEEEEYHFKEEGLKVSCLAVKYFTAQELQEMQQNMMRARTESADFIFNLINNIEKGGEFLSLVAFEEQPRSGALKLVHEAQSAGIQLVLTSSVKTASAAITALSLGMISSSQQVGILTGSDKESVSACARSLLASSGFDVMTVSSSAVDNLLLIDESKQLAKMMKKVPTILLERMEPGKIQQFVRFLKHACRNSVLAIGNNIVDSVYLQNANISVSMNMDAVSPCDLSCDITCTKLEAVTKMIFVHGGLLRERIHTLLNFINPRDTIYTLLQCVYGFHSGISGTPLFLASQVILNLHFFTLLPAFSRAIFNQKAPSSLLRGSPDYYKRSKVSMMSWTRILCVNIISILASIALLEISAVILADARSLYSETLSHAQFSFAMDSIFSVCSFCFLIVSCNTWPRIHHCLVWGSIILYFTVYRAITDSESSGQMRGSVSTVTAMPIYSLLVLFYTGLSLFIVVSYSLIQKLPKRKQVPAIESELLLQSQGDVEPETHVLNVAQLYRQ